MTHRATLAALLALTGAASATVRAATADSAGDAGTAEEIIVTGTRTSAQTAFTSTVPVDVISAEQLRATGYTDLGRALELAEPSVNYPRPQTTPSAANTRAITLRGLSPDEVLVLVNGKRWHTTAVINTNFAVGRGSAPFDLSTIPVAAVDHIEILRDAAAAQYGSDAIAGVINIILRSDDHGTEIIATGGATERGDGGNGDLSFSTGSTLGAGSLTVSGEFEDATHTNRAAEDQRFDRQTFSIGDPAQVTGSFALSVRHPGPWSGSTFYDDLIASRKDSTSLTNFVAPGTSALFPDGFVPHINPILWDAGNTLGLRAQLAPDLKLDISNTLGYSDADFSVYDTVNTALGAASPTDFQAGTERYWQDVTNLNLSLALPDLLAGANIAAGAEYRHEAYAIGAGEPASSAGAGASGFPGFNPRIPVDNSRGATGLYLDSELKPWRWLQLAAAGRRDHYSDFGDATTWKASARAEPTGWLALRGSVSTGFRAPSLQQEYYSSITSVANGASKAIVNVGTYQVGDKVAQALGASPLQPERSHDATAGLVLHLPPSLSLTVDVFRTDIDHRIALSDALTGADVTAILTQAGITNVQQAAFFTNALSTRTQGFDVTAHGAVDLPAALHLDAQLGFERAATEVRSLEANPALPALPLIGLHSQLLLTQAQPVNKLTSQLSLSRGPLTGTVAVTRYGQYVDAPIRDPQTFGAKTLVDLSLTFRATGWLSLTAGVLNAGDVFPDPVAEAALAYASFGGSYVYGEEGPFGVDGRSYYGRVEARF